MYLSQSQVSSHKMTAFLSVKWMLMITLLLMSLSVEVVRGDGEEANGDGDGDGDDEEEEECPVCRGVVRKILASVDQSKHSDMEALENAMDKYCKTAKDKEKTFCYYVTTIKREFSKPVTMGAPVDRICKKLEKKDASICELRYKAKSMKSFLKEMEEDNLKKMRVKDIRSLLGRFDRECKGCAEKDDFLNEIRKLREEIKNGGEL